ncbi:hypothetical protein [Flammeovirga aprica]|uniref:Transporter n=1 Tax=Flammeovirga aprica JL-4 TaxID=694437 RepID=A0A7X9RUW5_9BACT|nr:hypothetical protein [Flammeovirga aprica]NME69156.1 hypothetical protein [Flammeovirga aprica JL-4]
MNKILPILLLLGVLFHQKLQAQDSTNVQERDVSKPTNFYTFLDNNFEYNSTPNTTVCGYRANLTFSFSESHLLLAEMPLLYNSTTEKYGIGDLRLRYFWLPYKDYSKTFGAFGPSIDIFAPTGNFENGLGTGRWILAPGLTFGIMVADWIQFFPVLSYQYLSAVSGQKSDVNNSALHGATFQVITPIVFSKKVFTQLTPTVGIEDFSKADQIHFKMEMMFSYGFRDDFWINLFYKGAFKQDFHSLRIGFTTYF